ncbi:hypothetical protein [Croceibacterium aestuarii]|uniref:hypothetical protein n=1 Tax=Croceibacterium aestuarii TaxID=3064139 RepID=UPI00272E77E9|nr:hypothetical protein [Croceibacterium sp. D39]
MSALERQLADDRALRDAALAVFQADLRFIKEDLAARGVGGRIADRLGDSALDMVDDAVDYAESNKGQIGAAVAAVAIWFARVPILNGLADLFGLESDEAEPDGDADRSDDD